MTDFLFFVSWTLLGAILSASIYILTDSLLLQVLAIPVWFLISILAGYIWVNRRFR